LKAKAGYEAAQARLSTKQDEASIALAFIARLLKHIEKEPRYA